MARTFRRDFELMIIEDNHFELFQNDKLYNVGIFENADKFIDAIQLIGFEEF
jgi:hypothetical protein